MSQMTGEHCEAGRDGCLRVGDFMRRDDMVFDSPDDRIRAEDALMTGEHFHRELRAGLFVHGGDVVEERAFTVTSFLREGLSCIFFLDGEVDVRIGDRRFAFRGERSGSLGADVITSVTPERFQRTSMGRQHVRHLVVSATPEWLDLEAARNVHDHRRAARLFQDHLADHRCTPTPRAFQLVREVLAPSAFMPELRDLFLEGRAVELVAETLAAALRADRRETGNGVLTRHDRIRLHRARDLIAANLEKPLGVDMIAREAGISPSGLQRLFRMSEGVSVFEYVRRTRLEKARYLLQTDEVSVQEASAVAGYSNPANFTTAFRRRYGLTPREILSSRKARRRAIR